MKLRYILLGLLILNGCQSVGSKTKTNRLLSSPEDSPLLFSDEELQSGYVSPLLQENLWKRISMQLQFPITDNDRVNHYRQWYIKNPLHLQVVAKRAEPFLFLITERVEQRGLPLELALLPIVESSFDLYAHSHAQAMGLWQFAPKTARTFGLEQNWWYDGRRDVLKSTEAALDFLEYLNKKFDGNWLHAIAAYNCGEGRVFRAIKENKAKGKPTDFWSLSLPRETSDYVPKLLAISDVIKNKKKYGLAVQPIANKKVLALAKPNTQMELAMAAKLAGIPLSTLQELNPAYNRWATAPDGANHLLLPINKLKDFKQNFARIDKKELQVTRYQIKTGDALYRIAKNHNVKLDVLMKINELKTQELKIGQELILPNPKNLTMLATLNDASAAVTAAVEAPAEPMLAMAKTETKAKKLTEEKPSESAAQVLPEQALEQEKAAVQVTKTSKAKPAKELKTASTTEITKELLQESQSDVQTTSVNSEPVAIAAVLANDAATLTQEKPQPAKPSQEKAAPEPSSKELLAQNAPAENVKKAPAKIAKVTHAQPAKDESKDTLIALALEENKMTTAQLRAELKAKLIEELKEELKAELQAELAATIATKKATRLKKAQATIANASAPSAADTSDAADANASAKQEMTASTPVTNDAPASETTELLAKAKNKSKDKDKAKGKPKAKAKAKDKPDNDAKESAAPADVSANSTIEHIVASGESLWGIARKYQVSYQDLLVWNDLNTQTIITPGKKLLINIAPAAKPAQKVAMVKNEQPEVETQALPADITKPIELALVK
ncbi:MAG: transglycosylase SLT domain-containing protein [Vibrionaceae bacterium]